MSRPMWVPWIVKKTFPGRFMAARLTRRIPPLGRLAEKLFFEGDDIIYLPRDEIVNVGEDVEAAGGMVVPSQVIDHFIEKAPFLWINNWCMCRHSDQCKDYPIDLGCLFMGDAARGINPKLGREVSKEEAREHMRRCREAGLVQMIGRDKVDTVWLGLKPGRKLVTVCSCCPCCCLWKMLPQIAPRVSSSVNRMPGVTVRVTDACIGCGKCTKDTCFVDAIRLESGRAVIGDDCRGCGRCAMNCPEKAIQVSVEDSDVVRRAIERLEPLFDL